MTIPARFGQVCTRHPLPLFVLTLGLAGPLGCGGSENRESDVGSVGGSSGQTGGVSSAGTPVQSGTGGSSSGGRAGAAGGAPGSGGQPTPGVGGSTPAGGAPGSGGHSAPGIGGGVQVGGAPSNGGRTDPGIGGSAQAGGAPGSGGRTDSGIGGSVQAGGAPSNGGQTDPGIGGSVQAGGAPDSGGTANSGGTTDSGGTAGNGTAGNGTAGNGTDAVPSKGCNVADGAKTLTTGGSSIAGGLPTSTRLQISTGGSDREYIIDIPEDYDPSKPYRLIFSWHQAYGSDTGNAVGQYPANDGPNFDAENYAYFGLHREAMAANEPAIFVAPGGIGNFPWDYTRDVVLFDDLLALVTENLCIDESRVFTTGFSFGAMMSYGLSLGRASKLRGAVTMAAANYNLPGGPTSSNGESMAYFGITGMSDGTCPWGDDSRGGKACVLQHAKDNDCTVPGNITTATVGSKSYVCYDFEGCKEGYPVKACTFDGNHTPSAVDDGSNGGDDGLKAFVPPLAWEFITQF